MNMASLNEHLEPLDAPSIIRWSVETFGDGLVMSSSFGSQAAVMLHLVYQVLPGLPVILIDTGYLFPETYRFVQELARRFTLNLKVYTPRITTGWLEAVHGPLWEQGEVGLDTYHRVMKIEPMQRALHELGATAWLAGLRRSQTDYRKRLRPVEHQNGIVKIHPVLNWSSRQVQDYIDRHDLPLHPLVEKGYRSIGDVHLSRPVRDDEHERVGRFNGMKQECGLHVPETVEEVKSRDASGL